MTFATIIRESGLNLEEFDEHLLNITIFLYDRKNRLHEDNDVHYFEPLFKENQDSLLNFKSFINGLNTEGIDSINIMIDESFVVLFYNSSRKIYFPRNHCMDFYDYMQ